MKRSTIPNKTIDFSKWMSITDVVARIKELQVQQKAAKDPDVKQFYGEAIHRHVWTLKWRSQNNDAAATKALKTLGVK